MFIDGAFADADRIIRSLYRDPDYIDDPQLHAYVMGIWQPLVQAALLSYGSEEQLQRWLPPLISGAKIGCFAITEQGDNYAILSAGTGTLTGKSYNHLTRIVRRTVTEGAEENVVTVSDATLVSLTNSVDVAKRMADYYRHRETIRVDVEEVR